MSSDEEVVEFLKGRIRRDRRTVVHLLQKLKLLRRCLSREAPGEEDFRECAMSDADWRLVGPVADLLIQGQWVPWRDYVLIRDTLIEHADELMRLLPESEIYEGISRESEMEAGTDD